MWALLVHIVVILFLGLTNTRFRGLNFSNLNPGRLLLRVEDSRKIDELDVLFLGSSHAFMGFDTRIFNENGLKSFNFGSMAQTPIQTEYLYEKYAQHIKVDLIVYEVNPTLFYSDGVEATIDFINTLEMDNKLFKLTLGTGVPNALNTMLYVYLKRMTGAKPQFVGSKGFYIDGGGYVEGRGTNKYVGEKIEKKTLEYKKKQLYAFERLISLFLRNKQKFILVQAPVTKNHYYSLDGVDKFDEKMKSFGEYYNFNHLVELNDTNDFVDNSHMNQQGVEKFNKELLKIIFNKNME